MKKNKKFSFWTYKKLLFCGIFLSGFGGYSPPQRPKKSELSGWQLSTRKNSPDEVRFRDKKCHKNVRKSFLQQKKCAQIIADGYF